MPDDEGLALVEAARRAGSRHVASGRLRRDRRLVRKSTITSVRRPRPPARAGLQRRPSPCRRRTRPGGSTTRLDLVDPVEGTSQHPRATGSAAWPTPGSSRSVTGVVGDSPSVALALAAPPSPCASSTAATAPSPPGPTTPRPGETTGRPGRVVGHPRRLRRPGRRRASALRAVDAPLWPPGSSPRTANAVRCGSPTPGGPARAGCTSWFPATGPLLVWMKIHPRHRVGRRVARIESSG